MKISSSNDYLSFGSKIKIVSPELYRYKVQKFNMHPNCDDISSWDIKPEYCNKFFYGYRTNLELGFTNNIRSCTGGLVMNENKKASLFMHIMNSVENKKHSRDLKKYINGTNAILVGSKDKLSYSRVIFDKFKQYIKNAGIPLTIMQGLAHKWQTSLAFDAKKDVIYMCIDEIGTKNYVKNMNQLKKTFRKVEVSPTDNVEFIGKFKEKLLMIDKFIQI